jgi:hypothetical protein
LKSAPNTNQGGLILSAASKTFSAIGIHTRYDTVGESTHSDFDGGSIKNAGDNGSASSEIDKG